MGYLDFLKSLTKGVAMPLYEYSCPSCGTFEVLQKFSDAPLKECPTCGKDVSKLMSRTSFQLKGTGWYASDYKKSPASSSTSTTKDTASEKVETKTKDPAPGSSGSSGPAN